MGSNHRPVRSLKDRLESRLMCDPNSGCWIWTGATKEYGYGVIGREFPSKKTIKTHRAAWIVFRGPIPEGMNVLHKCDIPPCCNPNHLYLGSLKDNARDTVARGRDFRPDNRGERAKWAKLSQADADYIKTFKDVRPSGISTTLARQFGVSRAAIYQIWAGNNWSKA